MSRLGVILLLARLLPKLGLRNIFWVLKHRILLRLQLHPACRLKANFTPDVFFKAPSSIKKLAPSSNWRDKLKYFDWLEIEIHSHEVPNWFSRPISKGSDCSSVSPWWKVEAPGDPRFDIKEIWDLSRFNWVLAMAQRAAAGDDSELDRLNLWLVDWAQKNPPYYGPNWMCGQEASIRVMHLAIASVILSQEKSPTDDVIGFLKIHASRISSTLEYALSQDNNHGVLEATGLFVAGEWLYFVSGATEARLWADQGRYWLEERAARLIHDDGGFSMYSVTYHREFLDAFCIAEYWRQRFDLKSFSPLFLDKALKATSWLKRFTHPNTGGAPNIGANDGTRLMPLSDTGYRDFRPSVQLASVLFTGGLAYPGEGSWNLPLHWLDITVPSLLAENDFNPISDNTGFISMNSGFDQSLEDYQLYMHYPRFKFRPSHADALHIDFWVNGVNLLRDGGSYSYNHRLGDLAYFVGTQSHNTAQFDERDQMPIVSTFLLGDWLSLGGRSDVRQVGDIQYFQAEYRDRYGATHGRSIELSPGRLFIKDVVSGFSEKVILRWRLMPGDWKFINGVLSYNKFSIEVDSSVEIKRIELVIGFESLCYWQKESIPVLEVELDRPGTVDTTLVW